MTMYSVAEVDLHHEREAILSAGCSDGVAAVLYSSGELIVQDVDDDSKEKRIHFFSTWIKNPYKVFVHPLGHYIIVSSTDGLLHFFSSQESSWRCTVELTTSDLRHRIFVAECVCWLPVSTERTRRAPLDVLVGATSMGVCFHVSFEFLSRSIKPLCSLFVSLPSISQQQQQHLSINGVFYTGYGSSHIVVLSTPLKLFYVKAEKSKCEKLCLFLDDVKDHKWNVEQWVSSPVAPDHASLPSSKGGMFGGNFGTGRAGEAAFQVFAANEHVPRSFCWVYYGVGGPGMMHGLFDWTEDTAASQSTSNKTTEDEFNSPPFCRFEDVEYVAMVSASGERITANAASSAASAWASLGSSSSIGHRSVSERAQAVVVPTSSHMVFLLGNRCVAVQHPAGIPWRPPSSSPVPVACTQTEVRANISHAYDVLEDREMLEHAIFDSTSDSTLTDVALKGVFYDANLRRLFIHSTNTIWEVILHEDRHRLWDLFLHRGANPHERESRRLRYFNAARKVVTTEEERNRTEFLSGFFLISSDRVEEGVDCLAKCDWFEDIFIRLKDTPSVCETFLEKRFMLLASAFQQLLKSPSSSVVRPLESALQGIVHTVVWWKCKMATSSSETKKSEDERRDNTKSIDAFIEQVYALVPSLFDNSNFCDQLVHLLLSFELDGDSCITLYMKTGDYSSVLSHFIDRGNVQRAVQTLAECDPRDENLRQLWCKFLPKLITHAPVALLTALRRFLAKARRNGDIIDIDGLLPSFFLYKINQNEAVSKQAVHQVKLLLNSAIYKYQNESEVIHNYYLYLLAEEGDEEHLQLHLEHSQKYDICYAVQCCLQHEYKEGMRILHKRLGFYSDVAIAELQESSQAKGDTALKNFATSKLDDAQLKWMWRSVLLCTLERQGTQEALKVVEHSQGVLTLEDLLQCVKDDNAAVETLKQPICQQLDHLSSLCVHHAKLYTTTLQAVGISKYQLHEVQQQVSHISSTQKCVLCGTSLLGRTSQYEPYLVYPTCKHAVHEICAVKKLKNIGSADFLKEMINIHGSPTYENLAAADCVICGEAAILEVSIPMI